MHYFEKINVKPTLLNAYHCTAAEMIMTSLIVELGTVDIFFPEGRPIN